MDFPFVDLPLELATYILTFLSARDLVRCARTCKYFRSTVTQSACLQYTVDLEYYKMVPLLSSSSQGTSYAERRNRLRQRESSWAQLNWHEKHTIPRSDAAFMYDFVDGLYGVGYNSEERRFSESVIFYRLPPYGADVERKTWKHDFHMIVLDFTMDPSQDLLVLLAVAPAGSRFLYRIYLRTISTNDPHPSAASPFLPFFRTSESATDFNFIPAYRLRILGDLVGILVKETTDTIGGIVQLWNWEFGSQSSRSINRPGGFEDFTFLSPSAFLISDPKGVFELYTFMPPNSPSSFPSSTPTLVATLALPLLQTSQMYWYNTINLNPGPGHIPTSSSSSYYLDPNERILGCALGTTNPAAHIGHFAPHSFDCFIFFVNVRVFLDLLPPPSTSSASCEERQGGIVEGKVINLAWDKWGSKNTRWFRDMLSTNWQHAIFGFRTVDWIHGAGTEEENGNRSHILRVRDFNPHAVLSGGEGVVTEPSILPSADVFLEDIESSLPYREILSTEGTDVCEVMIDACRIVLLKDGNADSMDVLCF